MINTSLRVGGQDLEFTLACFGRRDKVYYKLIKKAKKGTSLRTNCIMLGL